MRILLRYSSCLRRSCATLTACVLCTATAMADPGTTVTVTYLPASDVSAAFAKGRPLVEVDGYKIHASRREAAGEAEVHTRDTDLIYVLQGNATIVTGGTVIMPRSIASEELRGAGIDGGETHTLSKGDVLVVPNGVPHWFKAVEAPFLYYVVKVAAPKDGGTR